MATLGLEVDHRGRTIWSLGVDERLISASEFGDGVHDATSLTDTGWLALWVSAARPEGHSGGPSWSHS